MTNTSSKQLSYKIPHLKLCSLAESLLERQCSSVSCYSTKCSAVAVCQVWVGGGSADPVVPGIFYLKYKIWRLFLKGSCSLGSIAHLSSEPQMIYTELSLLEKTCVTIGRQDASYRCQNQNFLLILLDLVEILIQNSWKGKHSLHDFYCQTKPMLRWTCYCGLARCNAPTVQWSNV